MRTNVATKASLAMVMHWRARFNIYLHIEAMRRRWAVVVKLLTK